MRRTLHSDELSDYPNTVSDTKQKITLPKSENDIRTGRRIIPQRKSHPSSSLSIEEESDIGDALDDLRNLTDLPDSDRGESVTGIIVLGTKGVSSPKVAYARYYPKTHEAVFTYPLSSGNGNWADWSDYVSVGYVSQFRDEVLLSRDCAPELVAFIDKLVDVEKYPGQNDKEFLPQYEVDTFLQKLSPYEKAADAAYQIGTIASLRQLLELLVRMRRALIRRYCFQYILRQFAKKRENSRPPPHNPTAYSAIQTIYVSQSL